MSDGSALVGWLTVGSVVVLKATLVLMMALLAGYVLRRRAAAEQHGVWLLGVVAAVLLPFSSTLPAAFQVKVPIAEWMSGVLQSLAGSSASEVERGVAGGVSAFAGRGGGLRTSAEMASWSTDSIATLLVVTWLAGTALVLLWTLLGHVRAQAIGRYASSMTDPELRGLADSVLRELRVKRPVRVLEGMADEMPKTGGVFRPWLLLPEAAVQWPRSRQEAVLRHELAHVARYDTLVEMVLNLACAMYWFHPLVWMSARRLRDARERACDDIVLLAGTRPADYAGDLLAIARSLRAPSLPGEAAIAVARPSRLRVRLSAVLDERPRLRGLTADRAVPAAGMALLVLLLLGATHPIGAEAGDTAMVEPGGVPTAVLRVSTPGVSLARPARGGRVLLGRAAPGGWDAPPAGVRPAMVPSEAQHPEARELAGDELESAIARARDERVAAGLEIGPEQVLRAARSASASVTYTIVGTVAGSAGSPIPAELVRALRGGDHLSALQVSMLGTDASFRATLVFQDLAEFEGWYASDEAGQVRAALERLGSSGEVRTGLSYGSAPRFSVISPQAPAPLRPVPPVPQPEP